MTHKPTPDQIINTLLIKMSDVWDSSRIEDGASPDIIIYWPKGAALDELTSTREGQGLVRFTATGRVKVADNPTEVIYGKRAGKTEAVVLDIEGRGATMRQAVLLAEAEAERAAEREAELADLGAAEPEAELATPASDPVPARRFAERDTAAMGDPVILDALARARALRAEAAK